MVIEMLLYHLLDETALLQVSDTASTGPWTDLRLPSTMPIREALAEWANLASGAFPAVNWDFFYDEGNGVVQLFINGGGDPGWIKCTETLQALLGQPEVGDGTDDGSLAAGITSTANGVRAERTTPLTVESADFEEFRGGRVTSYHYGRAREVGVTIWIPDVASSQALLDYPLFQGLCAFRLELNSTDDYAEGDEGGRLTLYPFETVDIRRIEGNEDFVKVELKTTVGDAA